MCHLSLCSPALVASVSRPASSEMSPTILGISRRDLLKEVLSLFGEFFLLTIPLSSPGR